MRALGYERRALTEQRYPWLVPPSGVAGIAVTPTTALRSPTVLAGVRLLSETIGQLPLFLFERDGDNKARATEHAAYSLVHDWANPWTPAFEFRRSLTADAILKGGGFAQVIRTGGRLRELHRLSPDAVAVEIDELTSEPSYQVSLKDGGTRTLTWRDILHVPGIGGCDEKIGLPSLLKEAIGVDLAMAEHQGKLFGNGARPSGVLQVKGRLGPEPLKRLKESWNSAHGGGANSGGTALLEEGTEFVPLTFSSTDAQFLELRKFAVEDVARGFGIPLTLVGSLERATWRNAEEMVRQFLQFALLPWLMSWQGALARALLTDDERESHFFEFSVDALVKADLAARMEAYAKAIAARILNPNEARARENLPAYEGGDTFENPNTTTGAANGDA